MVTSEAVTAELISAYEQAQAWHAQTGHERFGFGPNAMCILAARNNLLLAQSIEAQQLTAAHLAGIQLNVERIGRIQRRANKLLERVAITLHEISKADPDDDQEPPDPSLDLDGQQPGRARAEGEPL